MTVLHIQKATGIAGAERHLLSLLPGLRAKGIDARILVLMGPGGEAFVDALDQRGVPVETLSAGRRFNVPLVLKIARELRHVAPSLVHTHLIHADIYGGLAARLRRIPRVSTLHSAQAFFARFPYRTIWGSAVRRADALVAVSEHVRDFVVGHHRVGSDRVVVIHHGIDPAEWSVSPAHRRRVRSALDLNEADVAIGVSSRLFPGKGHELLLAAFAIVAAQTGSARLVIAGDGPLRARLEHQAGELLPVGSFRFCGYVQDMPGFISAMDVMVFPSVPALGEGFGLVALEAMAGRRALIGWDAAPLDGIVDRGESGLLVPFGDEAALAAAIQSLVLDAQRRAELARSGREKVERLFRQEDMVARTLQVYERLKAT